MEMETDREELKRTESSLLEVIKMFRICEDTKKKQNTELYILQEWIIAE